MLIVDRPTLIVLFVYMVHPLFALKCAVSQIKDENKVINVNVHCLLNYYLYFIPLFIFRVKGGFNLEA